MGFNQMFPVLQTMGESAAKLGFAPRNAGARGGSRPGPAPPHVTRSDMVSPPLEEAAASAAPLRVEPAPRPLMGSQGRSGSPGNRGPREGEGGEARQLQEARVARGKRGKGKAGTGRGGRGSGAEGKPGLRPARKAAGPAAEAGPGREGEEGGGVEEGPRSSGQRDEGSAGPGAGRREDGSLERARERGWQAWGGVPGTRTAMAAAAEEAAAAAAEPATRPAAGPALWSLPEELLLLICSYLDIRALGRLAQVCRWLRRFTSCDLLWRRIARASLNSGFTRLGTDLMTSIPVKDRVRVSQNWRLGRCRQGTLLKWRCGQMPWMQLKDASLYISQANSILAYQFRPDGASLNRRPFRVFAGHDEDVCHFVLADSHIVSAGGCGLWPRAGWGSAYTPSRLKTESGPLPSARYSGTSTHQKRTPDLITDGCEPPYGCWELNSGPLEEQPVLLTSEPSLQP
ncbi:F-box/WD repeat-containing protein 4 isoform X6 [Mesocricetus auratus]|uniref:F-box/WD repeat-containing protein 4 isoform X6 n=1 Tax=Mesocricetus auratus TaxID=10036 RepID=A0ABM2XA38_MESAU|nr:F-box/WD repeat-containing protein 4 isoform X6 [Mesocricetus auratus]